MRDVVRATSIATFILWIPLILLGGYLLSGDFPTDLHFHSAIQVRTVVQESGAVIAGFAAILFAAVAADRDTRTAAARAFAGATPGAIWSAFLLWMLFGPWTHQIDPTLVGWLWLTDALLTIVLWAVWFLVWRTR